MNIKNNLFIAIARWIHGGSDPMPGDIIVAIIIVFTLAITIVAAAYALIRPYFYMKLPPYSLLLDIKDYDNDKYKIFLLRSPSVKNELCGFSYKGDFYNLFELIVEQFTFTDIETESVCKVSFAESNQKKYVQHNALDNFGGVLFYNKEENKWFFYRRPPTVKLRFYNKDNVMHVGVKISVIGSALPDMPPHTNLDDLFVKLLLNYNENYTIHQTMFDNQDEKSDCGD